MTAWQIAIRLFLNFATNPAVSGAVREVGRQVMRQSARAFMNAVREGTSRRERENVK